MTFTTTKAPAACQLRECVLATGEIERDSGKQLADFVRQNQVPAGATVVLQSDGGNLLGGLALGSAIRAAKLATDVEMFDARSGEFRAGGLCASACAYAFVGGIHRSVGNGCKLGVHQLAGPPSEPWNLSVSDSQWLLSLVAAHLDRMGVDMGVMVLALRTSPQDMHWLSPVELARYSVTNSAAA
jgi:hypothetical protein